MENVQRVSETRYWTVPVLRAAIAAVPATAITFNADHSSEFGLIAFGSFAVLGGLAVGGVSRITLRRSLERSLFLVSGVVGVTTGILALVFSGGGLGFFLFLVSMWAAVTGALELYSGVRSRRSDACGRDWMLMGGLTAVLALVFTVLPPDAVSAVGLFGAYLVLLAVYLVIAGLSLKWARTADPRVLASPNDSDTL